MATALMFVKFKKFIERLGGKEISLSSDSFKWALTATEPDPFTDEDLADITQISAGNGYSTGGSAFANSAFTVGSASAIFTGDDTVFTATPGSMAAFGWAVLYDDTHANDALIGYLEYPQLLTVTAGKTHTIDIDTTNGLLRIDF